MKKSSIVSIFVLIALTIGLGSWVSEDWGFFGHKRINRLAVFTLPQDLFGFYKTNIEYVTEHAVDPDKRRYATKYEAVRHYIDIDHWDTYPFDKVPRNFTDAVLKHADIFFINELGDSINVLDQSATGWGTDTIVYYAKEIDKSFSYDYLKLRALFQENIMNKYPEEEEYLIDGSALVETCFNEVSLTDRQLQVKDNFSGYGILPFHLLRMKYSLTRAFKDLNYDKILRYSSDYGHYLGDAHVPLHTTENYNGQFTDQIGIHGFWESRIPELLADKEWDFFVGNCEYIADPEEFFWEIVLDSHILVDSVLNIEKRLKETFPVDLQFCYADRSGRTVRTQCDEFTRAFDAEMKGMVEERMQASVLAIGSMWYTCWLDAGAPDLSVLNAKYKRPTNRDSIPAVLTPISGSRGHDY